MLGRRSKYFHVGKTGSQKLIFLANASAVYFRAKNIFGKIDVSNNITYYIRNMSLLKVALPDIHSIGYTNN